MIWLSNSTLARLRDQLLEAGGRPSTVGLPTEGFSVRELQVEYAPLCEAMYLMMAADGDVGGEEREVLRGALRNLSSSALRTADIDGMLASAERSVEVEGKDARLQAVAKELSGDRSRAEVAFVLAAAIAFADNAIADDENETLSALADGMGIDEERAEALLDEVERDLAAQAEQP
jgi:DnaJ-domain-containing protein 1